MHKAGPLEVKTDAQLVARQRDVAEPAARACGVARQSGDSRFEKRTSLLTNTAGADGVGVKTLSPINSDGGV